MLTIENRRGGPKGTLASFSSDSQFLTIDYSNNYKTTEGGGGGVGQLTRRTGRAKFYPASKMGSS